MSEEMTDKERTDTQKSLIVDLRLALLDSEKDNFSKEELLHYLDELARLKSVK